MLAKDLSLAEIEGFKTMLRKHPSLFISDYCEITGVPTVQHQINLKPNQKSVAQKLRRLGKIQQEALLTEVRKLHQQGKAQVKVAVRQIVLLRSAGSP